MSFPTLDSYRIDRLLGSKMRLVTLLAVTAVVFVHAYNMNSRFGLSENAAPASGAPGAVGFIEYLISQTLARWRAAMLFAISGFLFFHNLQPRWADYRRKYVGRLSTVVVPFLLWSALGLGRVAEKLFLHPVAYPLWFLQTLIVCFALAPLLY